MSYRAGPCDSGTMGSGNRPPPKLESRTVPVGWPARWSEWSVVPKLGFEAGTRPSLDVRWTGTPERSAAVASSVEPQDCASDIRGDKAGWLPKVGPELVGESACDGGVGRVLGERTLGGRGGVDVWLTPGSSLGVMLEVDLRDWWWRFKRAR
jgi:hypothetical protein